MWILMSSLTFLPQWTRLETPPSSSPAVTRNIKGPWHTKGAAWLFSNFQVHMNHLEINMQVQQIWGGA